MMLRVSTAIIGCLVLVVAACSRGEGPPAPVAAASKPPVAAATPEITLKAKVISDHAVEFEVHTTLPLPVQVMADLNLAGQKPTDTWIGYQERVTLREPVSTFVLDTSKSDDILPSGDYEAGVAFYPRWGATGNPAAARAPELTASQTVRLAASGTSRASAERKNVLQGWVMENVPMNTPWNEAQYVARLGRYQKRPSTMSHLHDAYYFPEADMTLIVNRLRNEITTWRMGNVTE